MSIILKLTKGLAKPFTNPNIICLSHRAISTTPTLLWYKQKFTRSSPSMKQWEQKFIEKDRASQSSQLIYRCPMVSYVTWSMHVSTLTSGLVGTAALFSYFSDMPLIAPSNTPLVMHTEDLYYFAAGFLAINALIRLVVSIFPLRIYKDNGKYLVVFHPQLPGTQSQYQFNQGEVRNVKYIFSPWNSFTYKLGSKTSLLFDYYFKTPSEFEIMSLKKNDSTN